MVAKKKQIVKAKPARNEARADVTVAVRLSPKTILKIRSAYLQGHSREELCRKFDLTYKKLDNLIQRHAWTADREEIAGKVRENLENAIITNATEALSRMNAEATALLDLFQKRIYDPEVSNEDLSFLIKSRNIVVRELLRSLGQPETIRNESGNPDEQNPFTIQIITGVGEKAGTVEKIVGGSVLNPNAYENQKEVAGPDKGKN